MSRVGGEVGRGREGKERGKKNRESAKRERKDPKKNIMEDCFLFYSSFFLM